MTLGQAPVSPTDDSDSTGRIRPAGETPSARGGSRPGAGSNEQPAAEDEIRRRVAEARLRLAHRARLAPPRPSHYRRFAERPFTREERDSVTILISGLTVRHERLIQAALEACGYKCQALPVPDLASCLVGKQYGNNGLCNPAYFTVGNLVAWLQQLEAGGLSRREIVDRYVFFTAGGCGPCRFGMYEAEFRLALRNAGFDGFRVLTFQQGDGVRAKTGETGFQFSLLLGLGALNAFQAADTLNDFGYTVRPYEAVPGSTDARLAECADIIAADLKERRDLQLADRLPGWAVRLLSRQKIAARTVRVLLNLREHLWSRSLDATMARCRERLAGVELDRLRVKPVVKVTGEFWAQSTEGDGNFRMFEFLEREGAQIVVDPLGAWVMYLLWQARARLLYHRGLGVPRTGPASRRWRAKVSDNLRVAAKKKLFDAGEGIYRGRYDRLRRALGGVPHRIADMLELERIAAPYYSPFAWGGEGHLEVAKNIYYSTRPGAHMVLSLKPFGCMPSTQSDGVQSAVVARFKDMLFLPIETAPEGELNAHSRVQMALVEARARAQAEFDRALSSTGRRLSEIKRYVEAHAELRDPFHPVPHRDGIVGVAANFVLYVSGRMDEDRAWRADSLEAAPAGFPASAGSTS